MLSPPVLTIVIPIAFALLVLAIPRRANRWRGIIALLCPAIVLYFGIELWLATSNGRHVQAQLSLLASLGAAADLHADRLGAFFVVLVGAIGLGVFQYARVYLGDRAGVGFWSLMLVFTGAMLGVVLSDNLILLYVFWELTTVSSALLVAIASSEAPARQGALQAFLVTAGGGLALLAGVVLLGELAGTYALSELTPRAASIVADPRHRAPLILLLLGAFTKSAQVPFHFWLPAAMAAPAPVSAFLHSATMVKAGIFLIARLFPIFADSPIWLPLLTVVGMASFLVAGWNALWTDDVKKLLAYSTTAYLGLLVAHYGYSSRAGLQGELVNIANHALYKSALFLLVGWVEKATGTRDLRTLARERWPPHEPVGTALFGLGALALAGSPLLLGFLSKEIFLTAVLGGSQGAPTVATIVVICATALSVAYALKIFTAMLFGSESPPPERRPTHAISPWLLVIPALLLLPQILGGISPGIFVQPLITSELRLPRGPAVWQHADIVLLISLASFVLGGGLFLVWTRLLRAAHFPFAAVVLRVLANGTLSMAAKSGRLLQSGGQPRYILLTLGAILVAAYFTVRRKAPAFSAVPSLPNAGLAWLPALVISAAAVLVLLLRHRLGKAIMLAVVGYGVAFYYVVFRAPDLVLTQLLVETVSLVLLLLAFRRMPSILHPTRSVSKKAVHALFCCVAGTSLALVGWLAANTGAPVRAGQIQYAQSVPLASGHNAVNVILVDFRGADTLGEITVLVAAALGVLSLIPRSIGASDGRTSRQ